MTHLETRSRVKSLSLGALVAASAIVSSHSAWAQTCSDVATYVHCGDPANLGPVNVDLSATSLTKGVTVDGTDVALKTGAISLPASFFGDAVRVRADNSASVDTTGGKITANTDNGFAQGLSVFTPNDSLLNIRTGEIETISNNASTGLLVTFGSTLSSRTGGRANISIEGDITASGLDGTGVYLSALRSADVTIAEGVTILGGALEIRTGPLFSIGGAGIIADGGGEPRAQAVRITNYGTIGAMSDVAIKTKDFDEGGPVIPANGIKVSNYGSIIGQFKLAPILRTDAHPNVIENFGVITFRNFADTDGDGVRDRLGDAVSEFGNAASNFINAKAGTIQVTGQNTVLTGLATFENAGTVDLRTDAPSNVMTITNGGVGTFVSNGGSLLINTRLGSDNSPTDKLVVDGTAVGPGGATRVFVTNVGGLGAFTTGDGIRIIEVKDSARSAAGAFTLGQSVAAGAYEYHLEHGSAVGNAADGNWYLRNPEIREEVPLYMAITDLARIYDLNVLGMYHTRGSDALPSGQGAWGRGFGATGSRDGNLQAGKGSEYDYGLAGLQVGQDAYRYELPVNQL